MRSRFLYEITYKVLQYNNPEELIINFDHTASKFVATDNITMATKGEKHISRAGATDKRAITDTLRVPQWLHATIPAHLYRENGKIFTRLHFFRWILLSFQSETLE